ncbi:MAG: TetR/AcrR family transcriptional regulator [Caldilineaceae bacterium]
MPKAFSEQEKAIIQQQLREKGQQLFALHGIKKTSVDDLVQAVGISKGAFYLFYPSKEELLLDSLEHIEAELQTGVLTYATRANQNARQNVRDMLRHFLLMWDAYPLLKHFTQEDYMLLARKLPPERLQGHADRDEAFITNFTAKLASEGITMHAPPRVVANLIKSLFFVGLHRDELGEDAYRETMAVLVDLVAGYVTEGA